MDEAGKKRRVLEGNVLIGIVLVVMLLGGLHVVSHAVFVYMIFLLIIPAVVVSKFLELRRKDL